MSKQELANGTVIRFSDDWERGRPNQSTSENRYIDAGLLSLINHTSQGCRNIDSPKHCHENGTSDLNLDQTTVFVTFYLAIYLYACCCLS